MPNHCQSHADILEQERGSWYTDDRSTSSRWLIQNYPAHTREHHGLVLGAEIELVVLREQTNAALFITNPYRLHFASGSTRGLGHRCPFLHLGEKGTAQIESAFQRLTNR
jgi:hypothetical protein